MLILALILASQAATPTELTEPADFLAYVAQVKAAGATEDAQSSLRMVANIIAGETTLEIRKDSQSGQYSHAYMSATCPRPGLSAEELARLRNESADRVAPILKVLRTVADSDCSGFISSKEGWALRQAFEFGADVAAMTPTEGTDKIALAKLLHITPSEFDARSAAYAAIERTLAGIQVRFLPHPPQLPQQ